VSLLPRVEHVAKAGDAVVVRGFAAAALAAAVADYVPGGVDAVVRGMGMGPRTEAIFRASVQLLQESANDWHAARATSADGRTETGLADDQASSSAWISSKQAAQALGVTDSRVRQLARTGELASLKVASRHMFRRDAVIAFREGRRRD